MSEAYKKAGVDLQLGDDISRMLYEAAQMTWSDREGKFGELTPDFDAFHAGRSMSIRPLLATPEPEGLRISMGDDGVGTKVEVAQRVGDNSTIAHDLFAMVVDDAVIKGFEPVAVTTTLDVSSLKESMDDKIIDLARGYWQAANQSGTVIVNGEVAELGDLIGGYGLEDDSILNYCWNATLLSVAHEKRMVTSQAVQPGQKLVAFQEKGFRSNGLSLVRRLAKDLLGDDWHEHKQRWPEGKTMGEMVLTPSVIYAPTMVRAFGGYDLRNKPEAHITGAAHITGGGIPGKLGRMLQASGNGAVLEDLFTPPKVMLELGKEGDVSDEEMYRVWNMGQGMIVATDTPDDVLSLAKQGGIEAKIVGEVTRDPHIRIKSRGSTERMLTYQPHK